MDEDRSAPEVVPPEAPSAAEEGQKPERKGRRAWVWVALTLLCFVAVIQGASVLLRDRLERRRIPLAAAPAPAGGTQKGPAAPAEALSNFGPEVREVEVGAPPGREELMPAAAAPVAPPAGQTPTASAGAPKAPPAAAPVKPPAPAVVKVAAATRAAAPAELKPQRPAPGQEGSCVLLVDVFLSQRYLREAESRLKALGIPHSRTEITRPGRGYRLAVGGSDEGAKARRALEAAGYVVEGNKGAVEAYFYYRDEARAAAEVLAKAAVASTPEETSGDRPFWKLYAGPFSGAKARETQTFLAGKGLKTTLEKLP